MSEYLHKHLLIDLGDFAVIQELVELKDSLFVKVIPASYIINKLISMLWLHDCLCACFYLRMQTRLTIQ
jgi:hypothetical protein